MDCRAFEELDASGRVVASRVLESVRPVALSTNTVSVALLARAPVGGGATEVLLGLDEHDLPAAQAFAGNSDLFVTPAWRVPAEITTMPAAHAWIRARLGAEYGVEAGELWDLGGPYRPSPGLTAETVFPLAVEVAGVGPGRRPLAWAPVRDLIAHRAELPDGHLRVALLRAAHALGL